MNGPGSTAEQINESNRRFQAQLHALNQNQEKLLNEAKQLREEKQHELQEQLQTARRVYKEEASTQREKIEQMRRVYKEMLRQLGDRQTQPQQGRMIPQDIIEA